MDMEHFLKPASKVTSGKGLHLRKQEQSENARDLKKDIIAFAVENGISETSTEFGISDTAVAKHLSREIKSGKDISITAFMNSDRVNEIESFIRAGNTTSIKRMVLAAGNRFTEAEIRMVKADIEHRGADQW